MLLPGEGKRTGTLVVADTSGFHYRGWAPAGTIRVTGKNHGGEPNSNRQNPWLCWQRIGTLGAC